MQYVKEIFDVVAGSVFWVDSAASSVNPQGTFNSPMLTVQAGVAKCLASNGDVVLVKAGHAETITAQIDFNVAGVTVRGLGRGDLRPKLTPNLAGDCIDVSADNMTLENFSFGVPGTDAQTSDINVDAAGFTCRNCKSLGSAGSENKARFFVLTANADDCLITTFNGHTDVVDMVNAITFAALDNLEVSYSTFSGDLLGTIGYSSGTIVDSGTAKGVLIHHTKMMNHGAAGECITFGSNSSALLWENRMTAGHNTIANTSTPGTAADSFQTFATANPIVNGKVAPVVESD